MNRDVGLARLANETFDILVVGGGATGLGAAVDAAARGYRTGLIEAGDFAGATSSRSTKLIHGGVRYLRAGNIGLVREALRERSILRANAPHIINELTFVVPAYRWRDLAYYAAGLRAYDFLGSQKDWRSSRIVSASGAQRLIPGLRAAGLRGAITYSDGQFDDARLAITLARTAVDCGAAIANYVRATGFLYDDARISGVTVRDEETGDEFAVRAHAVINATGIFSDDLRALDDARASRQLVHSRGTHIVIRAESLGSQRAALLVPRTADARVVFAIPWHDRVLIGTTDIAADRPERDPQPTPGEVSYLLATVNGYLEKPLDERDIVATFAGLRPLVKRRVATTAKLNREHLLEVGRTGLVTIAGGKWTTYRKMGADAVDAAQAVGGLRNAPCATRDLRLHGATRESPAEDAWRVYGSDARAIDELIREDPPLGERLHPALPYRLAEIVYAVRMEMARTVEDVLARRTRAFVLDDAAARESIPRVASLLAREQPAVSLRPRYV